MTTAASAPEQATPPILRRVVVGVDGTESGFEACRQVARLATRATELEAVAVVHLGGVAAPNKPDGRAADVLEEEAEQALDRAVGILGGRARKRHLDGFVTQALLGELDAFGATLVALGTREQSRASEILLGGVTGEVLHRASCSVLVARPGATERFPSAIVVGHDGSRHAADALAAARDLAAAHGSSLRVVVALVGVVNLGAACAPFAETVDRRPVPALVAASRAADLLVVGSRGLHGLAALGSVSERVAHRAACSVLVVRGAGA